MRFQFVNHSVSQSQVLVYWRSSIFILVLIELENKKIGSSLGTYLIPQHPMMVVTRMKDPRPSPTQANTV